MTVMDLIIICPSSRPKGDAGPHRRPEDIIFQRYSLCACTDLFLVSVSLKRWIPHRE